MPRGVARVLVAIGLVLTLGGATALAVAAQDETSGAVVVTLLNPQGAPLPGGCFTVASNAGGVAFNCDAYDGSTDGTTTLAHIPPGSDVVYEYHLPAGYRYADQRQPVTVAAGQNAAITLRPQPGGESVTVFTWIRGKACRARGPAAAATSSTAATTGRRAHGRPLRHGRIHRAAGVRARRCPPPDPGTGRARGPHGDVAARRSDRHDHRCRSARAPRA